MNHLIQNTHQRCLVELIALENINEKRGVSTDVYAGTEYKNEYKTSSQTMPFFYELKYTAASNYFYEYLQKK